MKAIDKLLTFFISLAILLFVLILSSCQEENDEVINPTDEEAITVNSNVASLISRTTLRDGSIDNLIDSSSCTSIVLPLTVMANGLEIIVDEPEDLETIEAIFDEIEDDEDILEIIFPITITLADHSEIVVNDEEELEDLIEDCVEGGNDDDIECIDFEYPITVNTFDTNSQVAGVITINNDEELHEFLDNLDEDDLISIRFPVTLILYDGEKLVVNNYEQLEDAIEDAEDDCDEDDDNDFDDDEVDEEEFLEAILEGEWEVGLFFTDTNETNEFQGFVFEFFEDGRVLATKEEQEIEGEWETRSDDDDDELIFELSFNEDLPFSGLQAEWEVEELDDDRIELENDDDDELIFQRAGAGGSGMVTEVIVEGEWRVALYREEGQDETADFNGFTLNFSEDGTVEVANSTSNFEGAWSEILDDDELELILDFGSNQPFDELNEDWEVVEIEGDRIELIDESDDDEPDDVLILEKI